MELYEVGTQVPKQVPKYQTTTVHRSISNPYLGWYGVREGRYEWVGNAGRAWEIHAMGRFESQPCGSALWIGTH
jgi:hypothetical protein